MRGFFIIYLALFYLYRFADDVNKIKMPQMHDITVFNYFNQNYFNTYYFNDKLMKFFVQSYLLDKTFFETYIYHFNLYILYHIKNLEVILKFEDFKYEEDSYWSMYNPQMLLVKNKKDIRKAFKMRTDYFHYVKRKNRIRFFNKYIKDRKSVV